MAYFTPYRIGMDKWEIDTPVLLVDLDIMEKNIGEMARFTRSAGVNLRPHVKNHMCPAIAQKQLEAGAVGFCCQTIGEAEIVAAWGIKDILITNEIVGQVKIERLLGLSACTSIAVLVDNDENAKALSQASLAAGRVLEVLIDVNTGFNRTGVDPGEPALSFAKRIAGLKGLHIKGINGYSPMHEKDLGLREQKQKKMLEAAVSTRNLLEQNGIPIEILSAGCTAAYEIAATYPGITEIQPGTYVFMDLNNEEVVGRTPADLNYALTLLATVTSHPTAERVVVDAGNKALATERSIARGLEGVELFRLSAEHGRVRLTNPSRPLTVGDKIEFIVGYCDGTVNRWNRLFGIRRGRLEAVWDIHHDHQ